MKDFSDLGPGLYIARGDAVKRIAEGNDFLSLFGHRYNEVESLAEAVTWVFIALNKRKTQMRELFRYGQWERGDGQEIDGPPFVFDVMREFVRVDYALQLTGQAFLLKQRRGRRVVGIRWLDPLTVQPDKETAEVIPGGIAFTRYIRTDPITGRRETLDGNDVIHFYIPGQREAEPGTTAGGATKMAAQVLYGMAETFSTFYENNALPVYLVIVPVSTQEKDVDQIQNRFWRAFNPRKGTRENRTIGVREGVTVKQLSINPSDLDFSALEDSKIKAIVTAHDVPFELIADVANYAVANDRRRDFVGAIGQRVEELAQVINGDVDIKSLGVSYMLDVEQHWSMKGDEAAAAISFQRYLQGMTPWAAAFLMGITEDTFPEDMRARGIWAQPQQSMGGMPDTTATDSIVPDVAASADDALMKASELAQFRRWYKKRLGADVDEFSSQYVTKADKLMVADGLLRGAWEDYP